LTYRIFGGLRAKTKLVCVKYMINEEFYTKHQTDSEVYEIDTGTD